MKQLCEGNLKGSFKGWKRGAIFEFANGSKWEQVSSEYAYQYAYSPNATVVEDGSRHFIQVDCLASKVEVKRLR